MFALPRELLLLNPSNEGFYLITQGSGALTCGLERNARLYLFGGNRIHQGAGFETLGLVHAGAGCLFELLQGTHARLMVFPSSHQRLF